jgi:asparagine synthase (glutamine-hydrolysing)
MCGIAGYFALEPGSVPGPGIIDRMTAVLDHRGPDGNGTWQTDGVALGSTRLAILDPDHGQQPMMSPDGELVVVYNGEIYNYPELRREMEADGCVFRTNVDTELLLHMFDRLGADFVSRLDGMFAFAIWDNRAGCLHLARDRFGVKPLYVARLNGIVAFASEIKALRKIPQFSTALDPQGISVLLGLLYIPEPWSIYRDVRKLRPGHALVVDRQGVREHQYFDLNFAPKHQIGRTEAAREVGTLLRAAVRRQMRSDVPVAVMLSGGLDSRSILACAAETSPGVDSYTIAFDEKAYDESPEARYWAGAVGSPHHKYTYGEPAFSSGYAGRQQHLDEPYALWCNTALAGLADQVRTDGFKVVLSGDGGDELFFGYPTVQAALLARLYRKVPKAIRQRIVQPAVKALPAGRSRLPFAFMARSFVDAVDGDDFRTFFGFKEVLRYELWPEFLTPEAYQFVGGHDPFNAFGQYKDRIAELDFVDALSYLDSKVFLTGNTLAGLDNAFMSGSVEARVPFLDNALVDFATRLPVDVRFHMTKLKVVLQRAYRRHLPSISHVPAARFRRYRKQGFEIPGNVWLDGREMSAWLDDALSPRRLEATGFFRPAPVRKMIDDQLSGKANNERILQVMTSLVRFLEGGGTALVWGSGH